MPTKTKTKQTLDVKTVDTPSDLATTNQSQLFDYSQLDNAEIIIEDIQVIRQNIEDISTKILDTGRRLTRLKNNLPHGQFLPTLEREFDMSQRTAYNFMEAYRELGNLQHVANLEGMSRRAIQVLTSAMSNKKTDEETKKKILDEVKEQTEEKGEALTEKEIKEVIANALGQVKKILSDPREAVKHTNEDLAIQFDLPLDAVTQVRENIEYKRAEKQLEEDRENLRKTIAENTKLIATLRQEVEVRGQDIANLHSYISEKENELNSLNKDKEKVKLDRENLDTLIKTEADKIVKEELKKKVAILDAQEADLKKKEAQIKENLKQAEADKIKAQQHKENLSATTKWLDTFTLTNEYLMDVVNELKKYKKDLQKSPDLSSFPENERLALDAKIKDLIVDFNDNLHELGGQINYLNGAVAKFNNHALRVIDAEVENE